MICGNGVEHDRYSWCGLELTTEEQALLASHLLGLWIHKRDSYAKDMLEALSEMAKNWKPNHFMVTYPIDKKLLPELDKIFLKCQKCCIPHSTIYSASSCPSCCAVDVLEGVAREPDRMRDGEPPEVSALTEAIRAHVETRRALQGSTGIQGFRSSDDPFYKS